MKENCPYLNGTAQDYSPSSPVTGSVSNLVVGFSPWYFALAFAIFLVVYLLLRLLTHRH